MLALPGWRRNPWIGQSNFSKDKHIFANLGTGTYKHCLYKYALMVCNAITLKILYNDAVAMTGGQSMEIIKLIR